MKSRSGRLGKTYDPKKVRFQMGTYRKLQQAHRHCIDQQHIEQGCQRDRCSNIQMDKACNRWHQQHSLIQQYMEYK